MTKSRYRHYTEQLKKRRLRIARLPVDSLKDGWLQQLGVCMRRPDTSATSTPCAAFQTQAEKFGRRQSTTAEANSACIVPLPRDTFS